jgi:hypothetical protein
MALGYIDGKAKRVLSNLVGKRASERAKLRDRRTIYKLRFQFPNPSTIRSISGTFFNRAFQNW